MEALINRQTNNLEFAFIRVVFNSSGGIVDSNHFKGAEQQDSLRKVLPTNFLSIVTNMPTQGKQVNATSQYQARVWQWSFIMEADNICGYAVEITQAQKEQELIKQHNDQIAELRSKELTFYFKKLIHDFRSPLSGAIGGINLISSLHNYSNDSDEYLLLNEINVGCKQLFEKIETDLSVELLSKSQDTVFKSLENINELLSECITNNFLLSEHFSVNFTNKPVMNELNYYCDANKLLLAINLLIRFICQQYQHSQVVVFTDTKADKLQCVFCLIGKVIKTEHQSLNTSTSEVTKIEDCLDINLLYDVNQLVTVNSGELKICEFKDELKSGSVDGSAFVFEFDG